MQIRFAMNSPKIIVHHLDSPVIWERDQVDDIHSRRKTLGLLTAVAGIGLLTAMFSREDTVEDYSHYSTAVPNITVQAADDSPGTTEPLLADSGQR